MQDIRFEGVPNVAHLRVCVSHVLTYSQEIDTNQSCEKVHKTTAQAAASSPHPSQAQSITFEFGGLFQGLWVVLRFLLLAAPRQMKGSPDQLSSVPKPLVAMGPSRADDA